MSTPAILVVDDTPDMLAMMAAALNDVPCHVVTATTGEAAAQLLTDQTFALVITDLALPGLNGLELARKAREKDPMTEVILVTGQGSLDYAVQALRQGVHDYLSKPFDIEDFLNSVQRTLAYRQLRLERRQLLNSQQAMLNASNRLARLNPSLNAVLAGIIDIAADTLQLTVGVSAFGDPQHPHTQLSAAFSPTWHRALLRAAEPSIRFLLAAARIEDRLHFLPSPQLPSLSTYPSLLAVPLIARDDHTIGALWIDQQNLSLSDDQHQQVLIFANQISGILENAGLFANRTRQIDTRNTLVEASQRMVMALDRDDVMQTILDAAHKVLPRVELALIHHKLDVDKPFEVLGYTSTGTFVARHPPTEALVEQVLRARQPFYDPQWQPERGIPPRSLVIKPLVLSGLSLGALTVISSQDHAFDREQQLILTMLGNQAAVALQNARLYAEARRVDELEALYEAGKAINMTLDLQQTLNITMRIATSLSGALLGSTYLFAPHADRIDSAITLSDNLVLSDTARLRASQIATQVLHSQNPALLIEPSTNGANSEQTEFVPQAWLAVPLTTDLAAAAVLVLAGDQVDTFTPDDIRVMQVVASQANAAIKNARLYEEAQQRLQQTEALRVISQSISNTLDLSKVLELLVRFAVQTIPSATYSTLYLQDAASLSFQLKASFTQQETPAPARVDEVRLAAIHQAARSQQATRTDWHHTQDGHWSLLLAPLVADQRVIGVISVESPRERAFQVNDEILLSAFASHASIAVQNANLFRDLSSAYANLAQQQDEILQKNSTLQALFDGITDGLYILDENRRIIAINRAEAERFRRQPAELIDKVCADELWAEATPEMQRIIADTFEQGQATNWESQGDTGHRGPFIDRDVRVYPILEKAGQVTQVIVFAQDVSEKRKLQTSLFQSANLTAVGRLASSVAHQINNPLTVILANAQLLEMEMGPDAPDAPLIDEVIKAGTNIRHIVQNLSDFSAQSTYDWFETDVLTTLEDAYSLMAHPLRKSRIEVVKQLDTLPLVMASANHLKVVWMNLLVNAQDAILDDSEAAKAGEIQLIAIQPDDTHIQIEIRDNGPGIPAENMNLIGQPFFTTKAPGKGVGLGLHTCQTIVARHQGTLSLENRSDGRGVCARVTLPVQMQLPL